LLIVFRPNELEMLAMTPVLWTAETALPSLEFEDDEAKKTEVLERCAVVGCVP